VANGLLNAIAYGLRGTAVLQLLCLFRKITNSRILTPGMKMTNGIATLADVLEIEKIPLEERGLPSSTLEALRRSSEIYHDQPALKFFLQGTAFRDTRDYSYSDVMRLIYQTANMFHDLGIGPRDTVSLVMPNAPETIFSLWAGEAAGIVNPINPLLDPGVIAEIMITAKTKVLVTLAPMVGTELWQKVASIVDRVPTLETILQVDLSNYLSFGKRQLVRMMRLRQPNPRVKAKLLDFTSTVAKYPHDRLVSGRQIQPDDVASYFHTGGTTGTPKLAQHTHFNEVFNCWSGLQNLGGGMGLGKVAFCGLPLFHVNGVIVSTLMPLSSGALVVLGTPQGYRGPGVLQNFWKIVEHFKVNFFSAVPTLYSTLLELPVGKCDLSSLEYALCGAAPMPVELFRNFEQRTGLKILEGYGQTEGTCVSSVNPGVGERRIGSIGFRLPYQEMKIVALDANGCYLRDCEIEEIGTIVVRGPNVFKGYSIEKLNRGVWLDTGDGGKPWLNSGDLGRQDAEGYFWITGRSKELIIRGGHNIDPRLIEDALHAHPAVALAAAVGRPDAHAGELPVAYVQLKSGAQATAEELMELAEKTVGERAAVPKAIHIVDSLPVTAVGKIFKPQLIWQETEKVLNHALDCVTGVASHRVQVGPDSHHGKIARISMSLASGTDLATIEPTVREAIGKFAIHYELEFKK
jgi:fatty-acyl-CoA synthase